MGRLSHEALEAMGFAAIGKNVVISDKASFYNCASIALGDNARIDDFCVLSAGAGGISLGNNVHIAAFSLLVGAGRITLADFSGISSRVSIYSSTDDYSGATMTNPTIPSEFTGVAHADVSLGKHVIVGSGSVILPGAILEEGVAVGALSLVKGHCPAFGIYAGNPAKRVKERKRDLLELERQFLMSKSD
jgi:galactoside O-acetyltransferase